jgi:polyhydroxyalkanoate synthase
MLEAVVNKSGVLESERMGAAFMMLRSRDLLWTPAVDTYLRGERAKPNDLMSWNQDGTRMPGRMYSEYLDRLYLKNELAQGKFSINTQPVDLKSLRMPMFVVGTETDHVAPWRAVYKARELTRSADYTFLLTSGGHNAGIVSGPSHPRRRHRVLRWTNDTDVLTPEEWLKAAPSRADSWWPLWQRWLAERSDPKQQPARPIAATQGAAGSILEDAPGRYVRE